MSEEDRKIVEAIHAFWHEHGYGPSSRNLAAVLGQEDHTSIYKRVIMLTEEGHLIWPVSSTGTRVPHALQVAPTTVEGDNDGTE